MRWSCFILLFLCTSTHLSAQSYFEGEVIYRSDTYKRIKGKLVRDSTVPADYIQARYKDGNWVQRPEGGIVEYMYFDKGTNKIYWKLRGVDTLFYEDGRYRRAAENDAAPKYRVVPHADTLLGKVCNSLTIQTKGLRLTVFYDGSLAVDPAWYRNTRIGFYDELYARTKSVFLKSVVEIGQSVSVMTALEVYHTDTADSTFPTLSALPQKKLR